MILRALQQSNKKRLSNLVLIEKLCNDDHNSDNGGRGGREGSALPINPSKVKRRKVSYCAQ